MGLLVMYSTYISYHEQKYCFKNWEGIICILSKCVEYVHRSLRLFLTTCFDAASAAVMESIGTFKVLICRHGKLTTTVRVRVETIDGSANEGEDYQAVNEVLTFEPHEPEKQVPFSHLRNQ